VQKSENIGVIFVNLIMDQTNIKIEAQLALLAEQVAILNPLHRQFLDRVEKSVSVGKKFQNEAGVSQSKESSAQGKSSTF
jgi:hypothetical protein